VADDRNHRIRDLKPRGGTVRRTRVGGSSLGCYEMHDVRIRTLRTRGATTNLQYNAKEIVIPQVYKPLIVKFTVQITQLHTCEKARVNENSASALPARVGGRGARSGKIGGEAWIGYIKKKKKSSRDQLNLTTSPRPVPPTSW
jgi:hypothetical protein